MCGRYTLAATWAQIHAFSQPLTVVVPADDPQPAWNIAPTQHSTIIVAAAARAGEARQARWGLVPSWARDTRLGASMINARLETAAAKPAFRAAWKARRCLVPASGYYEWQGEGRAKQPYWIHPVGQPILMFAGLWERWRQPDGGWLESFAILTRPAAEGLLELHDRQPLMLAPGSLDDWLNGEPADAATIAAASATPTLAWHAVDRAVGKVSNQGPALVTRIDN